MMNLVNEILLRLAKAGIGVLLGALVFAIAVWLGETPSVTLALLCWISAARLHPDRPGEPALGSAHRPSEAVARSVPSGYSPVSAVAATAIRARSSPPKIPPHGLTPLVVSCHNKGLPGASLTVGTAP